MSKASEYVNRIAPLKFEIEKDLVASVGWAADGEDRIPVLALKKSSLNAIDALNLARWIFETFGDSPQP